MGRRGVAEKRSAVPPPLKNSATLLASNDPQAVVNELCREVMIHLDCQAFFNFLREEIAERLHLNAYAGIPEEEAGKPFLRKSLKRQQSHLIITSAFFHAFLLIFWQLDFLHTL